MKYLILFIMMPLLPTQKAKTITRIGMSFTWEVRENVLACTVSAPGFGWVAVGFNKKDQLEGTNLIMGAVKEDFYCIDDRYIVRPGLHENVLKLGADEKLFNRDGFEDKRGTTIKFSIDRNSKDSYHHDLVEGQVYYLLLAFSREDDFDHHSTMRTSVKIKL